MHLKTLYLNLTSLFGATKHYWRALVVAVMGAVIASGAEAGIYRFVVPQVLNEGLVAVGSNAWKIPLLILGFFLLRGAGNFLAKYFMGYVGRSSVRDNRIKLLTHMLYLPVAYFKQTIPGSLVSKINYETELVATTITDAVLELAKDSITIIFLLGVMFSISWQLSIFSLILFPVIALYFTFIGKKIRRYSSKVQHSMGNLTNVATEVVASHCDIKSFCAEDKESARIATVCNNNCVLELKIILIKAISDPILLSFAAVALASLVYLASKQNSPLNPGLFVAFFGAMFALVRPLKRVTEVNSVINRGVVAHQSISALLAEAKELDAGQIATIPRTQTIEVSQLHFTYPQSEQAALTDINFKISTGQMLAIVGKSGAGKSTLLQLLQRFYSPASGAIFFDANNIQDLSLHCLRQQMALVPQNVRLFSGTVAENICYGLKNVSEDKVIAALELAGAYDFVAAKGGIHWQIGEHGGALSGGQSQRLAIARALLRQAPIILLDEATAALDTSSEQHIQQALATIKQYAILIVIAHRLSTVKVADTILVLERGRIVEQGDHTQLLELGGTYSKLYSDKVTME